MRIHFINTHTNLYKFIINRYSNRWEWCYEKWGRLAAISANIGVHFLLLGVFARQGYNYCYPFWRRTGLGYCTCTICSSGQQKAVVTIYPLGNFEWSFCSGRTLLRSSKGRAATTQAISSFRMLLRSWSARHLMVVNVSAGFLVANSFQVSHLKPWEGGSWI